MRKMLAKFKVKGFKCFKKEITLDLSKHKEYQFNNHLIKNDIINKAIIYGKNGSGKTNLGFALFDIVFHLTDKNKNMEKSVSQNYLNLENKNGFAEFTYEFVFDGDQVIYKYRKSELYKILYEEVLVNGKTVIKYDFENEKDRFVDIPEAETLNWKYSDELSILKYICNNTIFKKDNVLLKLIDFVNSMLWFRSVDAVGFIGLKNNADFLSNIIIDNNKVKDFEQFLRDNDLNYNLDALNLPNGKMLIVKSGDKIADFENIASTGTKALWLYYCWELFFNKVKFLFIDEFDATYHFELAASIVNRLNENTNFQSLLTSHNTYLMKNNLTRPDCTFIVTNENINSLAYCTDKELREAHNIEKLYREGAFVNEE